MSFQMKSKILICIFLFAWVKIAVGQGLTNVEKARSLNGQTSRLLEILAATGDSAVYYSTAMDAVKTAMLCDFYDSKPDGRGTVKPLFRTSNAKRLGPIRDRLVEGGLFYYNHRRNDEAMKAFELYIETAGKPLFKDAGQELGLVTYYAGLLSYGMKDYAKAEYYTDLALRNPNYARDAAEVKINCMRDQLASKGDSMRYVKALTELHKKAPENNNYFSMLVEYYTSPGRQDDLERFVKNELRRDSTNKILWVLRGEAEMKRREWDRAIASYRRSVVLDSMLVPSLYNIGICFCSKAMAMKDSLVDKRGRLTKVARVAIRNQFGAALPYLERVRQLDPNRKTVDWAIPLYQIYFVLEDKDKVDQLGPLLRQNEDQMGEDKETKK